MTLELSDKHARLDALRKMLAQAKGLSITVGVHDAEGSASHQSTSATVADIASFHEFGTNRIPARSFLRAGSTKTRPKTWMFCRSSAARCCKVNSTCAPG